MIPINSTSLLNLIQAEQVSVTALTTPLTIDFYENWIAQNHHGAMSYLKEHLPMKKNPQLIQTELKSSLIFTFSYFPAPFPTDTTLPARTALYARNKDYHFWIKEKLNQVIQVLLGEYPDHQFRPFVDSGPVLERDLAYRAGLGWFGKNTCLIHPKKGSLFFISEILCSVEANELQNKFNLQTPQIIPDFCGKCTRCIDICPTQALQPNKTMIADRCISYLTIESKTNPPVDLREKISDWFFGCDLCQTVCPWNQKPIQIQNQSADLTSTEKMLHNQDQELEIYFKDLLTSSAKKIQKMTLGTPLYRSGAYGLKRNALVVIGNKKLKNLQKEVESLLSDEKLGELAQWCLDQFKKS